MKKFKENLIVFGSAIVLALLVVAFLVGWNVLWLTQPWKDKEKNVISGKYIKVRPVETENGLSLQFTPGYGEYSGE